MSVVPTSNRKPRALIVLLATIAAASWAVPGASASEARTRTFPVVSDYREGPGAYDGVKCRGLSTSTINERTCTETYVGEAHFTGGFRGTQRYELDTWLRPDGKLGYEGYVVFRSTTIPGCGTGDIGAYESDGFIDVPKGNPATGAMPGYNRWKLLPETATGGLKGRVVGGSGENHWQVYGLRALPGMTGDFGNGRFTGTVTCRQ
ncbi:MAG TPA: hypothetical protein VNB94_00855 [Mycobacteriales bacterium]|nr:hypothetical protein [Mycobacteriales bacterium]